MTQIRISIADLKCTLAAKLAGEGITEGTHAWRSGEQQQANRGCFLGDKVKGD